MSHQSRRSFLAAGGALLAATPLGAVDLPGPRQRVTRAVRPAMWPLDSRHLFDLTAQIEAPQNIGQTPSGTRQVFYVTGGSFQGERLSGDVLPGGGDWMVRDASGVGRLDVRLSVRTHDGHLVYVRYRGVLWIPPDTRSRMQAGEAVGAADYYFRV
ncbi:MAG: DUF3237 domain-containing protein, partial [Gemmatimonadota bacterium]